MQGNRILLNVTLYTKILLLLKNQLNQVWLLSDVLVCSVLLGVDYFYCQCVLWLRMWVLCSVLCFLCSVFCVVEYIHYLAAVGSKSPAGQLHMSLHVHQVLPLHLFTFANFATVLLLAHVHQVLPLYLFTFADHATVLLTAVHQLMSLHMFLLLRYLLMCTQWYLYIQLHLCCCAVLTSLLVNR